MISDLWPRTLLFLFEVHSPNSLSCADGTVLFRVKDRASASDAINSVRILQFCNSEDVFHKPMFHPSFKINSESQQLVNVILRQLLRFH